MPLVLRNVMFPWVEIDHRSGKTKRIEGGSMVLEHQLYLCRAVRENAYFDEERRLQCFYPRLG